MPDALRKALLGNEPCCVDSFKQYRWRLPCPDGYSVGAETPDVWMKVFLVLPEQLAAPLQAAVSGAEPMNQAIKQCFASGRTIDGVVVKQLYHLRTC